MSVLNCTTEVKMIMAREDFSTPIALGDSTIGVLVHLLLASSRDAPSTLAGCILKGEIIPHVVVLFLVTFALEGFFTQAN